MRLGRGSSKSQHSGNHKASHSRGAQHAAGQAHSTRAAKHLSATVVHDEAKQGKGTSHVRCGIVSINGRDVETMNCVVRPHRH